MNRSRQIGAQLGSASVIVLDETVNMAWLVEQDGPLLQTRVLRQMHPLPRRHLLDEPIWRGASPRGKAAPEDIDLLDTVASQIAGKCLCALGEFSIMAVTSGIEQFRADFEVQVKSQDDG